MAPPVYVCLVQAESYISITLGIPLIRLYVSIQCYLT